MINLRFDDGRVQLEPERSIAKLLETWAAYVALAEQVGGRLITRDAAMAGTPGLRCEIQLVA